MKNFGTKSFTTKYCGTTRFKVLPAAWLGVTVILAPAATAAPTSAGLPVNVENSATQQSGTQPARWWPDTTEQVLARAGDNRPQILLALTKVPDTQRQGMQFLIENMPDQDLSTLSAQFLLKHVAFAYGAYNQAPWKAKIPKEIFLNDILPYASLNETRDDSAQQLRDKAKALVADCRTTSEAAQRLNEKLFSLVKVRYSTERQRPNQSPLESMASGIASCSGLSILLVDACRAVGVPARVAGTPMWANGRGNHTWVEIWDGKWRFLGAAEPDEQGLDHGWFVGDAAQASKDDPQHAIYASSFKKTGIAFSLVWAPDIKWVNAVNVTDRYAPSTPASAANTSRVLIKLLDANGKRVAAKAVVTDTAKNSEVFTGTTKDESADMNNFLTAELPRGAHYKLSIEGNGQQLVKEFDTGDAPEQMIVLSLGGAPPIWALQPAYVSPRIAEPLKPEVAATLKKSLAEYFTASPDKQAAWKFPAEFENLLASNEPAVRQTAWEAYRDAPIHEAAKKDYASNQVTFREYLSPYLVRTVGERPAKGWGLVIAMHGGGGTAKEVNDSQWQGMFHHYKEHPELGGYYYLSLRAPNDSWNGFYDNYVYPLVANLIKQFTLFGDVDSNKVFTMGYSHGGYGAYAIGPKMPDRFAAIHASAGAATDGESTPRTLRNTVFTAMVGERDTAYDRLTRNQRFDKQIKDLRGERTDIYPARVDVALGFEHGNLRDNESLVEMLPATRNPVPREVTWLLTDDVITDFYWLHTSTPGKEREIDATCRNNQISVSATNLPSAAVLLDSRLIDFGKPVTLVVNGQKSQVKVAPSLRTLCETLQRRGDPELAFTAQVELPMTNAMVKTEYSYLNKDSAAAMSDGVEPTASNDDKIPRFTWWEHKGTLEWVQYNFQAPRTLAAASVYWFDDSGRGDCRPPRSWRLLYKDGNDWKPVEATSPYGVERDKYNRVTFKPVTTLALRLEAQLQDGFSAGIFEWKIEPAP
jgi:hypothetical protein